MAKSNKEQPHNQAAEQTYSEYMNILTTVMDREMNKHENSKNMSVVNFFKALIAMCEKYNKVPTAHHSTIINNLRGAMNGANNPVYWGSLAQNIPKRRDIAGALYYLQQSIMDEKRQLNPNGNFAIFCRVLLDGYTRYFDPIETINKIAPDEFTLNNEFLKRIAYEPQVTPKNNQITYNSNIKDALKAIKNPEQELTTAHKLELINSINPLNTVNIELLRKLYPNTNYFNQVHVEKINHYLNTGVLTQKDLAQADAMHLRFIASGEIINGSVFSADLEHALDSKIISVNDLLEMDSAHLTSIIQMDCLNGIQAGDLEINNLKHMELEPLKEAITSYVNQVDPFSNV